MRDGVTKHGVGKWRIILSDPEFSIWRTILSDPEFSTVLVQASVTMATIMRKQLSTNIVSKYRTVVVEFKYHKVQVVTLAIAGSLSIKNEEVQVSVTLATIVRKQL